MIASSPLFAQTTKCLEMIFGSLCVITKTMLHDYLKGGNYDYADENLRQETRGISNTNSIAEKDFEMLDRLKKGKLNCNMITCEAIIMSRNNKTPDWKTNLTPEKRSLIMKWARQCSKKQYDNFKMRRSEIKKLKNENRLKKMKTQK